MKKAKKTISAVAALCIAACILPSCYFKISDKAKEELIQELNDGTLNIGREEALEGEEPFELPDSLEVLDTLESIDSLLEVIL